METCALAQIVFSPHTRWCRIERAAETAHTLDNVVTAAVFHAPMFALNADAWENACIYRATCAGRAHTPAWVRTHRHTASNTDRSRVPVSTPRKRAAGRDRAYPGHVDHAGGVPRADVRAERQRTVERLRAGHTLSMAMKSVRLRDVYIFIRKYTMHTHKESEIRIDMYMDRIDICIRFYMDKWIDGCYLDRT
jgi:hypothetical protein